MNPETLSHFLQTLGGPGTEHRLVFKLVLLCFTWWKSLWNCTCLSHDTIWWHNSKLTFQSCWLQNVSNSQTYENLSSDISWGFQWLFPMPSYMGEVSNLQKSRVGSQTNPTPLRGETNRTSDIAISPWQPARLWGRFDDEASDVGFLMVLVTDPPYHPDLSILIYYLDVQVGN